MNCQVDREMCQTSALVPARAETRSLRSLTLVLGRQSKRGLVESDWRCWTVGTNTSLTFLRTGNVLSLHGQVRSPVTDVLPGDVNWNVAVVRLTSKLLASGILAGNDKVQLEWVAVAVGQSGDCYLLDGIVEYLDEIVLGGPRDCRAVRIKRVEHCGIEFADELVATLDAAYWTTCLSSDNSGESCEWKKSLDIHVDAEGSNGQSITRRRIARPLYMGFVNGQIRLAWLSTCRSYVLVSS